MATNKRVINQAPLLNSITKINLAKIIIPCFWMSAIAQVQAALVVNERITPSSASAMSLATVNNSAENVVPNPVTAQWQRCVANLQPAAQTAGILPENYARYTANLVPDPSVLQQLDTQPEFKAPIWDYMAGLVDAERLHDGQQQWVKHQPELIKIEQAYGVPAAVVLAVWGVETNYGQIVGKHDLLQSLGTLSCAGRRQNYFRGEWFAAMRLLQRGDVQAAQLKGSWAGAFGQTQFMPSTYERLAVDFDGDGRRDLVSNTSDALASTAHFLKKAGWQTGMPWGFEVRLPTNFSLDRQGRQQRYRLQSFIDQGVVRADGSHLLQNWLSGDTLAALIAPAGREGPVFLVFQNFNAIYRYNAAESYSLAIAHLADRLQGQGTFITPWPTDDAGTSRAERREIQQRLLARGYDIGEVDGLIGRKTRLAIEQEEQRLGLSLTGRAGQKTLNMLRLNGTSRP